MKSGAIVCINLPALKMCFANAPVSLRFACQLSPSVSHYVMSDTTLVLLDGSGLANKFSGSTVVTR